MTERINEKEFEIKLAKQKYGFSLFLRHEENEIEISIWQYGMDSMTPIWRKKFLSKDLEENLQFAIAKIKIESGLSPIESANINCKQIIEE